MKCTKCGAELTDDMKFCSFCGQKVEKHEDSIDNEATTAENPGKPKDQGGETYSDNEYENGKTHIPYPDATQSGRAEGKRGVWNKLNNFEKIATVLFVIFSVICLSAFVRHHILAGIIAFVQAALVVVSFLMNKQVIKTGKQWMPVAALALSLVLLIPYSAVVRSGNISSGKINWNDIVLVDIIPEPESKKGKISSNSDKWLSVDISKISAKQYSDYVTSCKEKGFTIDSEQTGDTYEAFNADGYQLNLYFFESEGKMNIDVDAPEQLGTLVWPDSEMASQIPVPQSKVGKIESDDEAEFCVSVGETSIDDYKEYIKKCSDQGFTVDVNNDDKSFSAKNKEGYGLTVEYRGYNRIYILVDEPEYNLKVEVECVENLLLSKYDIEIHVDDSLEETLEHGSKDFFEFTLNRGEHKIRFVSEEDDTIDGEFKVDVDKSDIIKLKIYCTSTQIEVERITATDAGSKETSVSDAEHTEKVEETKSDSITVTMSEDYFIGMLYTDAEAKLREMGFSVFEYETLETDDINEPDDTIGAVEIKNWEYGKGDFAVGDTFESDAIVVLWYYVCDEPEPNLTVDNCPELSAMLTNKVEIDGSYSSFANKYEGRVIEFDGRIDYCTKHGDYKTRYDYLVSAGDYDPDHQIGPSFKFEDVNYFDLNTDLDTVSIGQNVHIVAKVVSFDSDTGLFYLDPVAVTGR